MRFFKRDLPGSIGIIDALADIEIPDHVGILNRTADVVCKALDSARGEKRWLEEQIIGMQDQLRETDVVIEGLEQAVKRFDDGYDRQPIALAAE